MAGEFMIRKTVLFCAFVTTMIGCSSKNDSPSPAPPAVQEERFDVNSMDKDKLAKANCQIEQLAITCVAPQEDIFTSDRLASLTFQKNKLDLQMQTLQEVQQSVDSQIKSGKLSEFKKNDALILSAYISANVVQLNSQISNKELEISNEKLYQTVYGTHCVGSYTIANVAQKIDEFAAAPGKTDQALSKTYESADSFGFKAHLTSSARSRLLWETSSPLTQAIGSVAKSYVDTDGEFSLKISDATTTNLDCFLIRADGGRFRITERPLAKRSITCKTKIVGTIIFSDYDLSFQVTNIDKNNIIELGWAKDGHMSDEEKKTFANLKYGARLVSDNGYLKFQTYEVVTQKAVVDLTLVNSAPNISFGFDDQTGNKVTVKCTDQDKIGK